MKVSTQKPVAAPGANKPSTPPPHFDKLRTMKTLRTAAFSEDQAGAIVESIDDAQRNLATKEDLNRAIGGLRTDMEKMELGLRADMGKMELSLTGRHGENACGYAVRLQEALLVHSPRHRRCSQRSGNSFALVRESSMNLR